MTIIYEPDPYILDIRDFLTGPLKSVGLLAAIDFIRQENKPWRFYAGVFAGATAIATGLPGGSITLYVVGDVLDAQVFKTPDSSNLRVFLNGVQHTTLETYAATEAWEVLQVILEEGVNRVDFVNDGPGVQNAGTIPWLALAQFAVTGATEEQILQKESIMATPHIVSYRFTDANGKAASALLRFPVATTITELSGAATQYAPLVDAVVGGKLDDIVLEYHVALPGGIKGAAVAGVYNHLGALLSFSTDGTYPTSIRLPGVAEAYVQGDAVIVAETGAMRDLVDAIKAGVDVGGNQIQPSDRYDYDIVELLEAKTSIHRK